MHNTSWPFLMFFRTGIDFPGSMTRTALSTTFRFSGVKKRRVMNPVWGRSKSSHSDLRTNTNASCLFAWFRRSPALTSRAPQILTSVSTEGEFTSFSTWLRNPSEIPAFSATALNVNLRSLRYLRISEPRFMDEPSY